MHVKVTGRLHLEAVHGLAGVRVYEVVAPGGHRIASPFLSFEPWLAYILAALPAYMRASFMQILALATYFSGPIKFSILFSTIFVRRLSNIQSSCSSQLRKGCSLSWTNLNLPSAFRLTRQNTTELPTPMSKTSTMPSTSWERPPTRRCAASKHSKRRSTSPPG